jgi:hypothetical protein
MVALPSFVTNNGAQFYSYVSLAGAVWSALISTVQHLKDDKDS